jgi:hypothetical protein
MPTSLHIPKELLSAVDRRARKLKMSRNRFVVRTLEKELAAGPDWSPGFFEKLAALAPEHAQAVDTMLVGIRAARTSKSTGAILVTANAAHMTRVPGLAVEDSGK